MSDLGLTLTFCGAAKTVTGSKYLIEFPGKKILVDCGLFQGRKELRLKNWDAPPFDPRSIDAVLLTHAHVDHCAYLPALIRRGLDAPVYCTAATKELLGLILPDAAKLQEEEAEFANRHGTSKHKPAKPLFDTRDAEMACALATGMPYNKPVSVLDSFSVTAACSGHILGSASLNLDFGSHRITFSGDVGQYDTPILPDPQPLNLGDMLVIESTYGDRLHADNHPKTDLARIIKNAVSRGGALLIPAFAVGRTQALLYYIAALEREGAVPVLPVYVDSPMAVDSTHIYRKYQSEYDFEAKALLLSGKKPLVTKKTVFCRSTEESKALNDLDGPRIIISASGMITGGRILHHMRRCLPMPDTTVLLAGYQAEGTRGRIIQSGAETVKIFGEYVPIRAHVETLSGLSAHADRNGLLRWLKSCRGSPRLVKVTHGEEGSAVSFAETLHSELGWNASAAESMEQVSLQ